MWCGNVWKPNLPDQWASLVDQHASKEREVFQRGQTCVKLLREQSRSKNLSSVDARIFSRVQFRANSNVDDKEKAKFFDDLGKEVGSLKSIRIVDAEKQVIQEAKDARSQLTIRVQQAILDFSETESWKKPQGIFSGALPNSHLLALFSEFVNTKYC